MDKPKKKRVKLVERDESYFTESANGGQQEDDVMVKDDGSVVFMSSKEAKSKRPLPMRPSPAPASGPAPLPDVEEIIASEEELPEPIDASEINDDVPEEETEFEEVEEVEETKPEESYAPVLAPGPSPTPVSRRHHRQHYSPAHEQVSGMPFLSQGTLTGEKSGIGGFLLLLAGIAAIGGIIYFLKRKS